MDRIAGYSEASQLTNLIEQLREQLGTEPAANSILDRELEDVLSRLVVRNQRLRVLHRLTRTGGTNEHISAMRNTLEQLDARLLTELPELLERLRVQH